MSAPVVVVLNGPNLNLLGTREPHLYGSATLADAETGARRVATELGLQLEFSQSNHEGTLIDWIHAARGRAAGIVINPAGLTSTSVALHDALLAAELPVIEVHVTNIHRREEFRSPSLVSLAARGVIAGLGVIGYELAVRALADLLDLPTPTPSPEGDR